MLNVIRNQAKLSYQSSQTTKSICSNIVETFIQHENNLLVQTSCLQKTFKPNVTLTFVLEIEYIGQNPLAKLTVKTDLGNDLTYQKDSLKAFKNNREIQANIEVENNHVIFYLPTSLQCNDKFLILCCVQVNESPDLFTIHSKQTITAYPQLKKYPIITVTSIITIKRKPFIQLDMNKNMGFINQTLTYTYFLANYGNQEVSHILLMDGLMQYYRIKKIQVETMEKIIEYLPSSYDYDMNSGALLLPNNQGLPITVPAANHTSPGRTIICIIGNKV